jgi:hypothetical protein
LDYISSLPHNALNDAQAIKAGYLKKYTPWNVTGLLNFY